MNENGMIFERRVWGLCLIVGQLLMTLSTFFWEGRGYGVNVGMLIVLASVCWIPGMMGLFSLLRPRLPLYATLGLPVAIYGCVGGALLVLKACTQPFTTSITMWQCKPGRNIPCRST
ncbi:MAG: hypothetical protein R2867_41600 [Caldilineaceae bacterium]